MSKAMGDEVLGSQGFTLHYHRSKNKKYKETVVFIHHMYGNHKTSWRHFRLLNDMGYDCVTFDLMLGNREHRYLRHSFLRYLYKGVFYIWYKQIDSILNDIKGDKIIFAFSGPALSAFVAAYDRTDIKKFICEGGPFRRIFENTKNLFYYEFGIKNPTLNYLSSILGTVVWGTGSENLLDRALSQWDNNVPILSFRGVKDPIVHIDSMREVFSPHPSLNLKSIEFPEGKHLDALREYSQTYIKELNHFLTEHGLPPDETPPANQNT